MPRDEHTTAPSACMWSDPAISRVIREAYAVLALSHPPDVAQRYLAQWLDGESVCSCPQGIALVEHLGRWSHLGVSCDVELHRLGEALRDLLRQAAMVPCALEPGDREAAA